jgi:Protein of unknown function (DUF3761)
MAHHLRTLCTAGLTLGIFALVTPATSSAQKAAVKCKDGTTSTATGRGACSGHGGVDQAATKVEQKTVKTEEKAATAAVKRTKGTQVTQTCADGTTTTATGRGACSGHGGVKAARVTSKATGAEIPITPLPPTSPTPPPPRKPALVSPKAPAAKPEPERSEKSTVAGSGGGEDKNPAGAIAQCKDGMYSHAKNHTGACSRHGGVARWLGITLKQK